jgi:hypothetical protein
MFHVKNNDDDLEKYLQSGSIMLLQIIHCSFFTNIQEMISSYFIVKEDAILSTLQQRRKCLLSTEVVEKTVYNY